MSQQTAMTNIAKCISHELFDRDPYHPLVYDEDSVQIVSLVAQMPEYPEGDGPGVGAMLMTPCIYRGIECAVTVVTEAGDYTHYRVIAHNGDVLREEGVLSGS